MEKCTYLLILLGSLAFPLSFSFERRINFSQNWKYLFPAIGITAILFIVWDHYFTINEVWSFNKKYICGIQWYGLPLEEILFFFVIPYCCVFIYESLNYIMPRTGSIKIANTVNVVLLLLFVIVAINHTNKAYTFYTSFFCSIYLAIIILLRVKFMNKFYRAFIVCLVPFFIVNGLLTSIPVVLYNNTENLGIRITTIPLDDFMYSFLMLLLTISLMEFFRRKTTFANLSRSK